ncbi:putative zinc-binding metallopeptidase [Mycobacterium hubeiense]|uniref:putative zinc-binding metallopeptidase n=1 Tax=Mycobacterium hubeiense TaxID=1867256 RepID=UPI001E54CC33|nr:putative zinc-binding metallopeptidase [Mycobacterium sp. QGD 101]
MRAFACPVCLNYTPFEADRCGTCDAQLGLHPPTMTMLAVDNDTATVDSRRWVRCTQAKTIAREKLVPTAAALRRLVYQLLDIGLPAEPFWRRNGGLAFDLVSSYTMHPWEDFAECFAHYLHITDTIDTTREAGMVLHADRVRFSFPHDMAPLECYDDVPVEHLLFDWNWLSMFFNRVNAAMGKGPLYPFEIPPPVVAKLVFVHRVIRDTARSR